MGCVIMAKFKIYKLHFKAPLHISDLREDASVSQKTIHSDTFHAALIACLAKVGEQIPENGNLGCIISDLFPYYQQDEKSEAIYFLPMPLQSSLPQLSDPANAKKVKKVQWVDSKLYPQLLKGHCFFGGDENNLQLIQRAYLTETSLPEDASGSKEFIKSEVMQRVAVKDRAGHSDAKPYYVDRITFCDASGLYFLVSGDDTSRLDKAVRILEMEGIGTDRYVGFGFFDTITKREDGTPLKMEIETPSGADHQVSLSMFIPESKEQLSQLLASEHVAYDFTRRGGWITTYPYNSYRKNAVYAFLPGSVFRRTENKESMGRIIDLTPHAQDISIDHPVWRNGQSITLPIIINNRL